MWDFFSYDCNQSRGFTNKRLMRSLDTICITQPIRDGDVVVSNGETSALGFFSYGRSIYRYLGIWYLVELQKRLPNNCEVANRDNPINDTSGFFSIDTDGNLILFYDDNDQTVPLWSTNASASTTNNSTAKSSYEKF